MEGRSEFSDIDHVRVNTPDGRVFLVPRDPTAILVPTAEFIHPYAGMSEEDKAKYMAQVEAPNLPTVDPGEVANEDLLRQARADES